MKFIPSFGEFATKGKEAFKRFPVTLLWAIIGTLITLFAIENKLFNKHFYGKIILTFSLGISWLIATRFFEEQFEKSKNWLFLITLGFLALFYFTLPSGNMNSEQITRFILYFIAGHLLVFVAPFILKHNKNAYFNYLKAAFIAVARSLFFSFILYLGIVLALLAIKHLFAVDFRSERYFQVFVICLGIVNTWIYLSDFPKEIHNQTTINYTKPLEILVKYILIPLVILYLIILYAYSFKILLNWDLPKGWVSYLVIALSFLGFSIQLLINPIQKTIDSRAIRKFYPWFYVLLLPLIVLLFTAIFRRISDYGVTENRYFVLILAFWILGMTLYMLVSKNKITKWFPLSLAALALLVSVGFWSVFSVSTNSQINQFKEVFNEIKSTNFKTSFKKKSRLKSIAYYLSKKEETDKLSEILGYNPEDAFKNKSSWSISNKIIDSLKINTSDKKNNKVPVLKNYYYLNEREVISIKGYDLMKFITNLDEHKKPFNDYFLSIKENQIIIEKNQQVIGKINCDNLVSNVISDSYEVTQSQMTLKEEFKNTKIKVVFMNISLDFKAKEKIDNASAYIYLKEK